MASTLPSELTRVIIREATYIPEIFQASSLQDFDTENTLRSADAIASTMAVKRALCFVSKSFRAITEEFLYEAIVIHKLWQIRPLVLSLRSLLSSTEHRAFRGERVKSLYFLLGHKLERFTATLAANWETIWPWGNRSLWGLLPACPRLQTLVINPTNTNPFTPLDAPTSLWAHLAMVSSHLRNLVISQVNIPDQHLYKVLASCKSLEILRIDSITTYNARAQGVVDKIPPIKVGRLLSYEEVSEYMVAASEGTNWPISLNTRILLRRLHSLRIITSNEKFLNDVELPTLHTLWIKGHWTELTYKKIAPTITNLIIDRHAVRSYLSTWEVLEEFPKVRQFTILGELDMGVFGSYPSLESLTLSRISYQGIDFLLGKLQEGRMIALKQIILLDTFESTIEQDRSLLDGKNQLMNRGVTLKGASP